MYFGRSMYTLSLYGVFFYMYDSENQHFDKKNILRLSGFVECDSVTQ